MDSLSSTLVDKKTFVMLNPVAGTSDRDIVYKKISQVLVDNRIPFHIHETNEDDNISNIIRAALNQGFERFLAVGGDGTVSAVANGLSHTDIPVIIIPTGSANSLAKIFRIPLALEDAADWWLSSSEVKKVDAMKVKERLYLLNITVGVSSQTLKEVNRQEKQKYGLFAYWIGGFRQLLRISAHKFRIDIDNRSPINVRTSELIVANSGFIQLLTDFNFKLTPNIRMDDSRLSVCYIRARKFVDYIKLAGGVISGRPSETRVMTCKDCYRRIRVRTKRSLPVQGDGELIGYTPISIELVPASVRFLVPERVSEKE